MDALDPVAKPLAGLTAFVGQDCRQTAIHGPSFLDWYRPVIWDYLTLPLRGGNGNGNGNGNGQFRAQAQLSLDGDGA
jgi:hypothetical protein